MPVFWLALMVQILVTNLFLQWHVRIFYTSGLSSPEPGTGLHWFVDRAQHLAIPVMALMRLEHGRLQPVHAWVAARGGEH